MADKTENGSLAVEYFQTASGSFIKYGYITMRKPTIELGPSRDYLKWFRELKECARDAGLLGHFEGTAHRPSTPGEQQTDFDTKRLALNVFVLASVTRYPEGLYNRDGWYPHTPLEGLTTPEVLEGIRDLVRTDQPLEDFGSGYVGKYTREKAIDELNYEWANLKAICDDMNGPMPDHFYLLGAWTIAINYDIPQVRELFVWALPAMPSIEAVKNCLARLS